jgi:hypothetical protein
MLQRETPEKAPIYMLRESQTALAPAQGKPTQNNTKPARSEAKHPRPTAETRQHKPSNAQTSRTWGQGHAITRGRAKPPQLRAGAARSTAHTTTHSPLSLCAPLGGVLRVLQGPSCVTARVLGRRGGLGWRAWPVLLRVYHGALRELSVALCRGTSLLCSWGPCSAMAVHGRAPVHGQSRPSAGVVKSCLWMVACFCPCVGLVCAALG